ncbi:unannotated protein [freshwater metagenome]|uniref:Unannotated protein n=1 Tax=freshwater metagenome TaxID=449393 RepID=A0A6J6EUG6_9ZZZZ
MTIISAQASSLNTSMPALWSRVNTNTSCVPLASAITWTGPRLRTASESSPSNAGKRLGMTRMRQWLSGPTEASVGSDASSLPGQKGHGRVGPDSTVGTRVAKSVGRMARSATMVTQRPVRGFRRS